MCSNNDELDLLEFLRYILGCEYISDLQIDAYNKRARAILEQLNLEQYPPKHLNDVIKYIYSNK